MTIQELVTERSALIADVKGFWDSVPEGQEHDVGKDKRDEIETKNHRIEELDHDIAAGEQSAAARKRALERYDESKRPDGRFLFPASEGTSTAPSGNSATVGNAVGAQSIGRSFTESEEFKGWISHQLGRGNRLPDGMRVGQSPAVKTSALVLSGDPDSSAGVLVRREYYGLVDLPFRPLAIRDVMTVAQTGSDLIEFPRFTSYTNSAIPVAEATDETDTSGLKPKSELTLEKVTVPIRTIAHWLPVTRRALSDAPQMRSYIDAFGRQGLNEALEDQIMIGNNTGEEFEGLVGYSGLTTQSFGTDTLTTTRKALTKVRVTGRARNINGFIMNPTDWESFDLLQDNEARYFFGGPSVMGSPRLWGKPVIEAEACPEGTCYVGDFKQMVLWDREEATIRVSDSHEDYFARNLVAILFELRAGFGILRPAAICEVSLS